MLDLWIVRRKSGGLYLGMDGHPTGKLDEARKHTKRLHATNALLAAGDFTDAYEVVPLAGVLPQKEPITGEIP